MLQEKLQDVAEAQDSTLPTASAERVSRTSVAGGGTKIAGKLAVGKSCVAAIQLRLPPPNLKINFKHGQPDVVFVN